MALVVDGAWDISLRQLMVQANSVPMLSLQEEVELATQWRERQDQKARDRLVSSHLRLVVSIAKRYRGYGVPLRDLVGEGTIGLMKAVDKFEPERGFRFATMATWWVKAEIVENAMRQGSSFKMPFSAETKRVFFKLNAARRALGIYDVDMSDEDVSRVATYLEVSERHVRDMLSLHRANASMRSLDAPVGEDGDATLADVLADTGDGAEVVLLRQDEVTTRRTLLRQAMDGLSERERDIVMSRHLRDSEALTLQDISERYGVSRERIRQIEDKALQKLVSKVRLLAREAGMHVTDAAFSLKETRRRQLASAEPDFEEDFATAA